MSTGYPKIVVTLFKELKLATLVLLHICSGLLIDKNKHVYTDVYILLISCIYHISVNTGLYFYVSERLDRHVTRDSVHDIS